MPTARTSPMLESCDGGVISLAEAARRLEVDRATVRRWIQDGAPVERPGEVGRGRGALIRLSDLRRWRAERAGAVEPADKRLPEAVCAAVARGLWQAFRRGNGGDSSPVWEVQRVGSGRAAMVLSAAFASIHREITGREPLPAELPREIEMLHDCAISALSARTASRS
jgi:hypothetical protein